MLKRLAKVGMVMSLLTPSVVLANQQYYWTCVDSTECTPKKLNLPYTPPVDVNVRCQASNGNETQPWWLQVDSDNVFISCAKNGINGNYYVDTCAYNQKTVKVHNFDINIKVKCIESRRR